MVCCGVVCDDAGCKVLGDASRILSFAEIPPDRTDTSFSEPSIRSCNVVIPVRIHILCMFILLARSASFHDAGCISIKADVCSDHGKGVSITNRREKAGDKSALLVLAVI